MISPSASEIGKTVLFEIGFKETSVMLPALLASPVSLLLTLLIEPLTDEFPV